MVENNKANSITNKGLKRPFKIKKEIKSLQDDPLSLSSRGESKGKMKKEIEKKAYDLFLKRKGEHGSDLNDWLEAEKIVKKQFQI